MLNRTFTRDHIEGLRALEGALASATNARRRISRALYPDEDTILNINQFLILFNADLRCLLEDVKLSRNTWHEKLYARLLVVTMFECVDDLSVLLGKNLRQILERRGFDSVLLVELNNIHKQLSMFKRANDHAFSHVRVTVLAHREHDAEAQLTMIQGLNTSDIEEKGYALVRWLTHCFNYFITLLTHLQAGNPQ